MDFHGKKDSGSFGVLNKKELTNFICHKYDEIDEKDAGRLAEAFITHDGNPGQGKGGTSLGYLGRTVFHCTALGGGATIFFTTENNNRPFINGVILAIAQHIGPKSNTYTVKWIHERHRVDWMLRNKIIL
ncbi:hypothetical protein [Citrobacter braakii]|uniref:hypothetical protein n=1 Tax=Citrobacter braakii TaxID=57706 RepID=UPI00351D9E24